MRYLTYLIVPAAILATTSAFAQDGCPDGSYAELFTGGTTASYNFSEFFNGSSGTLTCNVSAPVTLGAGQVGAYSASVDGVTLLQDGERAIYRIEVDGVVRELVVDGPSADQDFGDNVLYETIIGGRNGTIDTTLELVTDFDAAPALETYLDNYDFALIGYTTEDSITLSLEGIGQQRNGITAHLGGTANLLLGSNNMIDAPSSVTVLGAIGSVTAGAHANINFENGFSVKGGIAYADAAAGGASYAALPLLAGSVLYATPLSEGFSLFGEAGVWAAPSMGLGFSRDYDFVTIDDSDDDAVFTGTGTTNGAALTAFARAGVLFEPDEFNQLAFSASLAQNWLGISGYEEEESDDNLFPATFEGTVHSSNTLKIGGAWTTAITDEVDVTINLGAGYIFNATPVEADVLWVGDVTGGTGATPFAEYGARIGWAISRGTKLDAFVAGTSGPSIGTHVQVGTALSMEF